MTLSPAQFTGGPAEAKSIASPEPDRSWGPKPQGVQGQLLDPKSTPLLAAHHQTPEQFAKDPRTWWHGRFTSAKSRLGGGQGRGGVPRRDPGSGPHTRLKANAGRRASKPGVEGHLFPLRITGPVEGPQNMHPDEKVHHDLGPAYSEWGQRRGGRKEGYLYENAVESPGSISVGVPQRKGFLSTHKEMVQAAKQGGEKVHPLIDWASKAATEHTGEDYPTHSRSTYQVQQQLRGHGMDEAREKNTTHRTTYTTEGGRKKNVFRFSEDAGPNGALSPRQWQPSS